MKLATTLAAFFAVATKEVTGQDPVPLTPDYGDLIRLNRDENGVPILAWASDTPATGQCEGPDAQSPEESGCCLWPLASDSQECADAEEGTCTEDSDGVLVINPNKIDNTTCSVDSGCSICLQETDFGRTNVYRSPESVLDDQYNEMIKSLSLSKCQTGLDPAGRFVYFVPTEVEAVVEPLKIDSPSQNLAIYRNLLRDGELVINEGQSADIPRDADVGLVAARALGAAVDKGGKVTVDAVAYMNMFLGLPEKSTFLDSRCVSFRKEVLGTVGVWVEWCFLDLSSFSYKRSVQFGMVPNPPYIGEEPKDGKFEYLAHIEGTSNPAQFEVEQSTIMEGAFMSQDLETIENIGGFVQAADDARAVINHMHNWPVPTWFATNTTCDDEINDPSYNVYIKELQVPEKIVKGTEGREFAVYVEITTEDSEAENMQVQVLGQSPDGYTQIEISDPFTLGPTSKAHSFAGTVDPDLTTAETEISWTATILGAPYDYNTADNVKTATTQVVTSGSGQGGKKGWNMLRGL